MRRGRPTKLQQAARVALTDFLGINQNETLLIVADDEKQDIGYTFYEMSKDFCADSFYLEMRSSDFHGEEPPEAVSDALKSVDAAVVITAKSITHTKAKYGAAKMGVRVATMPGITEETIKRCLIADVQRIVDLTRAVGAKLQGVTEIRMETEKGTKLTMPVKRRRIIESTGVIKYIGESGNMPSGEVYLAPWEDQTNGTVVFDGSVAGMGVLKSDIAVEIKNGYAKKFKGGLIANKFEDMLKSVNNDRAFALAEFGIGTNYKAKIMGNILEDEKVLGTAHIGFGNNLAMGGKIKVPSHIDCLVKKPDIYFDDELVMENGKLLIEPKKK